MLSCQDRARSPWTHGTQPRGLALTTRKDHRNTEAGEAALHRTIVLDAAHAETPGEGDFLGPFVGTLSKGDQNPKDKAIRAQVLVIVEHGASSALMFRKEGETEGRAANPGRWILVDLIWNGTTAREVQQRTRRA